MQAFQAWLRKLSFTYLFPLFFTLSPMSILLIYRTLQFPTRRTRSFLPLEMSVSPFGYWRFSFRKQACPPGVTIVSACGDGCVRLGTRPWLPGETNARQMNDTGEGIVRHRGTIDSREGAFYLFLLFACFFQKRLLPLGLRRSAYQIVY